MRIAIGTKFLFYIIIYFIFELFIFSKSQHSFKTKYSFIIPYLSEWYHHPFNYKIRNLEVIFQISLSNTSILFYLKFSKVYLQALFKTSCLFTCSTTTLEQAVMYSFLTTAKTLFTWEIFTRHLMPCIWYSANLFPGI